MKKINFQNNITKVNKATFDEFQNNIEESCVAVSPTQPETNEKVWIQKGKNLFNRENNILKDYYLSNEGTYETSIGSYVQNYYIAVSPNTEYILWHDKGDALRVGFFDNNKIFISRKTTNEKNLHFTTPANCKYLIISWDVLETSNDDNNIQLEQGSTATEYEAYVEKKINVENIEFLNVETMGIETITNSNGTAIKFPDGTMICRGPISITTQIASGVGNGFYKYLTGSYLFAQEFIERPTINANVTNGDWCILGNITYNKTKIDTLVLFALNKDTSDKNYTIEYTATGRWK